MYHLGILLFLALVFQQVGPVPSAPHVEVYWEHHNQGTANKRSDYAFIAQKKDCRIQWNAILTPTSHDILRVQRDCTLPFDAQLDLHRAVLNSLKKRWDLSRFQYLEWGPYCQKDDLDWCYPIAKRSRQAPHARPQMDHGHFMHLANALLGHQPLVDLLAEFQIKADLIAVDKVYAMRLDPSPQEKKSTPPQPFGQPKVIYNVAETHFRLSPL